MTPETRAALVALVARWRKEADEDDRVPIEDATGLEEDSWTLRNCADALAAILDAEPAPQ